MRGSILRILFVLLANISLTACSTMNSSGSDYSQNTEADDGLPAYQHTPYNPEKYAERMPDRINTHEKTIVVDPNVNAWGAYASDGYLVRAGIATAGGKWCDDINRPCRTSVGTFRVQSLGSRDCISKRYPRPNGGGLMPYCMYFNNGMALHGSPDTAVVEDNVSHGCVRMRISDAEWLRYNFVNVGTKVVVKSY